MMQAFQPKWSIRDKQRAAVCKMLGQSTEETDVPVQPDWKLIVYDEWGQDILSPLLNVSELRDLGVTVYTQLHSARDPIEDVPAVYFCLPTAENVKRVCEDFKKRLYESYQLNFLSALSRDLLELLATASIESNAVQYVVRVYDMYCNFIALEDDLFIVRHRATESISYRAINNQEAKDSEIEASMDELVDSLFSVLVTLGIVPIIRCSRRNAAENIAKKLDALLRDHLKNTRSSLFTETMSASGSFQRPVLILLDRNVDTTTVLHHTWTYQALVHDLLDLKLNRVTFTESVEGPDGAPKKKEKSYDLDQRDLFWQKTRGKPFPEVAAAIEEELRVYKEKEQEIKRLKVDGQGDAEDEGNPAENTAKLTSAINSLPQLLERKRSLDMHTTLLTAVMSQLGERKLDTYYEIEEEIMNKKSLSKPVIEVLSDPQAGTASDRLRLYVIYYMDGDLSAEESEKCEEVLKAAGCNMASLKYLREMKRMQRLTHQPAITASHKTESLFSHASKMMKIGGDLWNKGVKKLLPTSGDLPLTRIIDAVMDFKDTSLTEDYLYLDPKVLRAAGPSAVPKNRSPFEEAIVFVVGGGNYTEYQNIVDFCERSQGKRRVIYGTSELMSSKAFLDQLATLGASLQ